MCAGNLPAFEVQTLDAGNCQVEGHHPLYPAQVDYSIYRELPLDVKVLGMVQLNDMLAKHAEDGPTA
tara:strand:+ start:52 stop:252 length:201 start_codon:yes stop_codon:yes gene_type:complete